jgi:hypothetical protein
MLSVTSSDGYPVVNHSGWNASKDLMRRGTAYMSWPVQRPANTSSTPKPAGLSNRVTQKQKRHPMTRTHDNSLVGSIVGAIQGGEARGRAVHIPRDSVLIFRIERPLDMGALRATGDIIAITKTTIEATAIETIKCRSSK